VSFLLDTNVCIAFLTEAKSGIGKRLARLPRDDVFLSSIVKAELLYGARASSRVEANLTRLDQFFASFDSLTFDDRAASFYGIVRAELRKEGRPIGANDLLIAAIALAHDATLVTRNDREFRRVVGLRLVSW
jgi:tRNA(fMet)-specific endonuclease VapC